MKIKFDQLIKSYLEFCKIECGYSSCTVAAYNSDLIQFLDSGSSISFVERIADYSKWLVTQQFSVKTVVRKWSTIRSFYRFCINEGFCEENVLHYFPKINVSHLLPAVLSQSQVQALLAIPDQSTINGLRDYLLIECLYSTGIRVSECVQIKLSDFDLEDNTLRITGKGNKQRVIPLTREFKLALDNYVRKKDGKVLWLFGSYNGRHMTRQMVFKIIKKYLSLGNFEIKKYSPHSFRHAFATHLIEGGARLRETQLLLGHEQLASTQVYTTLSSQYIKSIYQLSHPRATL